MRGRVVITCVTAIALAAPLLHGQDTSRARPAQKLDAVTVLDSAVFTSARLAGFERRRTLKVGSATFFIGEEIAKRGTIRLSDALRRAHGVQIVDSLDIRLVASSRWKKPVGGGFLVGPARRVGSNIHVQQTAAADLAPCIMQVAVDGQLKEWGFSVDEISVTEVHGIEVYPGAGSMPAEFGSIKRDGWCGLVMIWTKSR